MALPLKMRRGLLHLPFQKTVSAGIWKESIDRCLLQKKKVSYVDTILCCFRKMVSVS